MKRVRNYVKMFPQKDSEIRESMEEGMAEKIKLENIAAMNVIIRQTEMLV